jgi:hypothetical protein
VLLRYHSTGDLSTVSDGILTTSKKNLFGGLVMHT